MQCGTCLFQNFQGARFCARCGMALSVGSLVHAAARRPGVPRAGLSEVVPLIGVAAALAAEVITLLALSGVHW